MATSIKSALQRLLRDLDKGEYDHLGTFDRIRFQLPGHGAVGVSAGIHQGHVGIWIQSEAWDHEARRRKDAPQAFVDRVRDVLTKMSLEPQKGWDFEGGKNLITNRTKYGVGWTSMSCVKKSHSDYGSHFVLVREGVFKDGKDHKLRKDDQQLLRKEAA